MFKDKNGYTLIELLVTLTIVGLLFGFGYANFRDFSRRQHLYGVAKDINGQLRLIQSKALSGEKPSECGASNTLISYDFTVIGNNEYQITAECFGKNVVSDPVALPSDVLISSSVNPISFKVLGQGTNIPSGTNAVVTLSLTGSTTTAAVTVSSGGDIK